MVNGRSPIFLMPARSLSNLTGKCCMSTWVSRILIRVFTVSLAFLGRGSLLPLYLNMSNWYSEAVGGLEDIYGMGFTDSDGETAKA